MKLLSSTPFCNDDVFFFFYDYILNLITDKDLVMMVVVKVTWVSQAGQISSPFYRGGD